MMTEEEWDVSDVGRAMLSFEAFVTSIGLVTVGGAVGGKVMNLLGHVAIQADRLTPRQTKQFDAVRNEAIPSALAVIATWSAFEAWAQDFVKPDSTDELFVCRGVEMKKVPSELG